MIINNTTKRRIAFKVRKKDDGRNIKLQTLNFIPGHNQVTEAQYNSIKEHKAFKRQKNAGELVVVDGESEEEVAEVTTHETNQQVPKELDAAVAPVGNVPGDDEAEQGSAALKVETEGAEAETKEIPTQTD